MATRVVVGVWVWGLLEVGIEVLLLGALAVNRLALLDRRWFLEAV